MTNGSPEDPKGGHPPSSTPFEPTADPASPDPVDGPRPDDEGGPGEAASPGEAAGPGEAAAEGNGLEDFPLYEEDEIATVTHDPIGMVATDSSEAVTPLSTQDVELEEPSTFEGLVESSDALGLDEPDTGRSPAAEPFDFGGPGLEDPPTDPNSLGLGGEAPWLTAPTTDAEAETDEPPLSSDFEVLDDDVLDEVTADQDLVSEATAEDEAVSPDVADRRRDETAELFFESVTGFDLVLPGSGPVPVAAPSFKDEIDIVRDTDPRAGEVLATQISSRLRTEVTSVGAAPLPPEPPETADEHRELDPRPFLESLRNNPRDRAALQALRRIYTATESWDELIGLLLEQSEIASTLPERLELLREVARIFDENLEAPDKAQVALVSALMLDPRDEAVAEQLTGVTARGGLWSSLFSDLNSVVAQEAQADRRAALCARLGEWYLQTGHADFAEPCFKQALMVDSTDLRSLLGMAWIFEAAGDGEHLAEVLAMLPRTPPPDTPVPLCLRLASLYDRAGDEAALIAALNEVLSQQPDHDEALTALEQVLGRQGRWGELVTLLEQRAGSLRERDPAGAAELWRRVARLEMEQLEDPRRAEKTCLTVIELEGDDPLSLEILRQIYAQSSRWRDLSWVLERLLEHTAASRERAGLLLELARLEAEEFLQHDTAVVRLREALELEPRNEAIHQMLIHLLRQGRRWEELAEAVERYSLAVRDEGTRAELLIEAAELRATELEQLREAASLLRRALQIRPGDPAILGQLGEVLVLAGDHPGAFKAFREQGEAETAPRERAAALLEAAKLARDQLGRSAEAIELLERALSLDPSCREAVAILREERLSGGDWDGAARTLRVEIEQATSASARGRLYLELGEILRDRLVRHDEAIEAFEHAREALGDTREVAEPLFELYLGTERFAEAAEVGEVLAKGARSRDSNEVAAEAVRLAEVNLKIGQEERALAHLERAETAVPGYEPALPLLADLYEKAGRWGDAYQVLTRIARSEAGQRAGWLTIQARLGRVARLSGRNDEAWRIFQEILVEQPKHTESLRQLAAIAESRDDPAGAMDLLERVEIEDEEMRLAHRNRIVELARRTGDDARLEGAIRAVLELRPHDHRCLTLLLELQSRTERWTEAIETIETLAETAEGKPEVRAKYFSAAAKIYRDKLGDLAGSVRLFEKVLDEDWTNLSVFASLDRMLTQAREYTLQEKIYRHMIYRVAGKGRQDLEVELWHALGEIYRSRLGRFEEAAEAFAAANRLDPDNGERRLILAELYQALNRPDAALTAYRELLRLRPDRIETLGAMRALYTSLGQYDRVFCLCSALVARNGASGEEQKFFEDWLPMHQPLIPAQSSLSNEDWLRLLRHPDEDPYVSGIFETILSLLIASRVRPLKEFGLSSETMVDTSGSGSVLAQQFMTIVRSFGLSHAPQLHLVRSNAGTLSFAVTSPISSVLGTAMTQLSETQRGFLMARHLAFYQSGRYAAVLCPSRAELQGTLLTAVAAVTGQDQNIPAASRKAFNQFRASLQGSPQIFERLGRMVRKFLARGGKADLDRWLRGVDFTTCRAATLMVADPRVAAAALRHETGALASVPPKERVEDLVRFVATEDYAKLREILGVQVG